MSDKTLDSNFSGRPARRAMRQRGREKWEGRAVRRRHRQLVFCPPPAVGGALPPRPRRFAALWGWRGRMLAALLTVMGAATGAAAGQDYYVDTPSNQQNGGHVLQSGDTLTVTANIKYEGGAVNEAAVRTNAGTEDIVINVSGAELRWQYGISIYGSRQTITMTGASVSGTVNDAIHDQGVNNQYYIDGGTLAGATGCFWIDGNDGAKGVTVEITNGAVLTANHGFGWYAPDATVKITDGVTLTAATFGFEIGAVNAILRVSGSSIACGPNENSYAIHNINGSNGSLVAIGKGSLVNSLDNPGWIGIETESSWNSINVAGVVQGSNHALHVKNGGTPRGNVFNLMNGAVIEHSQWGLKNECPEEAYTSFITFGYAPGTNPNANDWLAAAGTGIGDGALTKVDNKAVITVNDSILGADAGSRWVAYVAAGTTILNGTARANFIRDLYVGAAGFEERQLIATADGPRTATRIVPVKGAKATLVVGEGVNLTAMDNLNIYQGGTLQVAGTLNVPNAFAIDGGALQVDATGTADVVKALAVEGGTVTVNGTMAAHDALTVTDGKLAVGAGGALNVADALTLTNAKTTVGAGGTVTANDAVTIDGGETAIAGTLNAPVSLDVTGGKITVDGALNAANELFLRGTTLTVNGVLTPPAVLNLLGSTLRGSGTVVGDVATAGQGGRIAPGGDAATGTLTFTGSLAVAAGDALVLRAGEGGTDTVAARGALTLAAGSKVTVTANGGAKAGAVYTLATAAQGLRDEGADKGIDASSVLLDYAFREDANSLMLAVTAKPGVYQEIAAAAGDGADADFAAALDQMAVKPPEALDGLFMALDRLGGRREVAAAVRQLSAASGLGAATGALAAQRHNAAMGRYFGDTFARDVALRMVAGPGVALDRAARPDGARFGSVPGRQALAPSVYDAAAGAGAVRAAAAPAATAGQGAPAAPIASPEALDVPMPADFDPAAPRGPLAAPLGDAAPGAAPGEIPAREWQGDGVDDSRDGVRRGPGKKDDKRAQAGGAPATLPDGPEPVEPAPEPRWNGFVVAAGSFGEQSHGGGVSGYSHKGVGALVGLERGFDANLTGGFQVGWARHDAELNDGLGEITDDVLRFGAHARWQNERFFALSTPSAGVHLLESERNIAFLGRTAKGERTGFDLSWFNQAGVAVEAPHGFYLLPTASLAMTWMRDPAYREGGAGAASLAIDAHDRWSLNSTLALRVGRPFQLAGVTVNPEIMGGWEHEFFEDGSVGCAFAAAPAVGWRTPIAEPARDRALLGASLTTLVRDRWEISARYEGRLWDGGHEHAFAVAVEFGF